MDTQSRSIKIFVAACSGLLISQPSWAQLATPEKLDAIYKCTEISNETDRLACFDTTVAEFKSAKESGDIIAVSKEEIEVAKKEGFGFNLPSLNGFGKIFKSGDKNDEDIDKEDSKAELTIMRTKRYDGTRTRFYFTNDQVWEQTSGERIFVPKGKKEKPTTAVIKKAAFGSYLLRVNGKSTPIRVKRVQ